MATTFSQAQIDSACTYLMTGGPGGGELNVDQFRNMVFQARKPQIPGSILSDFAWQLQLAINQGHSGISNSRNLCRDRWGAPADAFSSDPTQGGIGGIANNEISRFSVSISG
jgi:hypothetical protein